MSGNGGGPCICGSYARKDKDKTSSRHTCHRIGYLQGYYSQSTRESLRSKSTFDVLSHLLLTDQPSFLNFYLQQHIQGLADLPPRRPLARACTLASSSLGSSSLPFSAGPGMKPAAIRYAR